MESKIQDGESMEYREDMMEELAECPGMPTDRPGTTPNALLLGRFLSTCKGKRELLERCGRFGGGRKGW
jgi:hypothetical protein